MSRLVFPEDQTVARPGSIGGLVRNAIGAPAFVYADQAATTPADIQTLAGVSIPGGVLTVDAYSRLPLFLGPDGADTVYVIVDGGPVTAVYARVDDRIDALMGLTTFSKSLVIDTPTAKSYPLWRAVRPCKVTAVLGYRVGGTGAAVNAQINTTSLLGVDLSVSTATTWLSQTPGGSGQLAIGDTLTAVVVSVTGSPTMLVVQIDLAVV